MADRGFDGTVWSRAEFVSHLNTLTLPTWVKAITLHSMWAPNIEIQRDTTKSPDPKVDAVQRMKNAWGEVSSRLKGKGWHLTCFDSGWIGKGCDLRVQGIHAHSWNKDSIGVEMAANFDVDGKLASGKIVRADDPYSGAGLQILDTAAFVFARLLKKRELPANKTTIRFHKHEATAKKGGKQCPGRQVNEADFINRVQVYMGVISPAADSVKLPTYVPATVIRSTLKRGMTGGDVPVLQKALNAGLMVDGDFGPKTEKAVKDFQARSGLVADGIVGPLTWSALSGSVAPAPPVARTADVPGLPQDRKPVSELKTSKNGLDLIKHFEGLRLAPYDDVGSLAIGYGHSNRSKKPPVVTLELRITEAEAEKILASDLVDYENRVRQSITVSLKQGEFDALVSLAYNWGPGNLDRSNLKTLVNAGKFKEAEAEIRTILPSESKKYYAGIKRRRNKEADLFGGK